MTAFIPRRSMENYGNGLVAGAPHVSGALAVLKSLFPNLDYRQVRDRILATADETGIYADEAIYGQGRLDLDAATRPGGTAPCSRWGRLRCGARRRATGGRAHRPARRGALARYFGGARHARPRRLPARAVQGSGGGLRQPCGRLSLAGRSGPAVAGRPPVRRGGDGARCRREGLSGRQGRGRPALTSWGAAQGAWATEGLAPPGRSVGAARAFPDGAGRGGRRPRLLFRGRRCPCRHCGRPGDGRRLRRHGVTALRAGRRARS